MGVAEFANSILGSSNSKNQAATNPGSGLIKHIQACIDTFVAACSAPIIKGLPCMHKTNLSLPWLPAAAGV